MSTTLNREPNVVIASGNNSNQLPRSHDTSNTDAYSDGNDFATDDDDEVRGRSLVV